MKEKALRGDVLDVEARLAKSHYDLSVAENGIATQREALNQLLGRDVAAPFRVDFIPEQDASDLTLDSARQQALSSRPEIAKRVSKKNKPSMTGVSRRPNTSRT